MRNVEELKKLAVKIGCAGKIADVKGDTIAEVIAFMNANYKLPALPTAEGAYNLAVDSEGALTWTAVTA